MELFAPKPKGIIAPVYSDEIMREEHRELAKKYGVYTVPKVNLAQVIAEECIQVYDHRAVERYMDRKGEWSWFPLRNVDRRRWEIPRQRKHSMSSWHGNMDSQTYRAVVPLPVLMTVDKISSRMGESVGFYVAALKRHPDPFLAAISNDGVFIVERWDEPGFRG